MIKYHQDKANLTGNRRGKQTSQCTRSRKGQDPSDRGSAARLVVFRKGRYSSDLLDHIRDANLGPAVGREIDDPDNSHTGQGRKSAWDEINALFKSCHASCKPTSHIATVSFSPPEVAHALKNVLEVVPGHNAPSANFICLSRMKEDSRLHSCLHILQGGLFVIDGQKLVIYSVSGSASEEPPVMFRITYHRQSCTDS